MLENGWRGRIRTYGFGVNSTASYH